MLSAPLRIGVAGAGHFGRYHALKAAAGPRAKLVGVHDPDTERARTVGWEAGAPDLDFLALLAACDAADRRRPRRGASRTRRRRAARRQARAGGEADRRHTGPGRRPRRPGSRAQPGASGRPSGAVLRRARRARRPHRCAALYRGHPHRAVQAAWHRRVGHPRPDDPRPRSGAVAGGQPDRACRCGRRGRRQRARGHRQRPHPLRQRRGGDDHRQPYRGAHRAAHAHLRPRRLHRRGFRQPPAHAWSRAIAAGRCLAWTASASRKSPGRTTTRSRQSMRRSSPRCWMARRWWWMPSAGRRALAAALAVADAMQAARRRMVASGLLPG